MLGDKVFKLWVDIKDRGRDVEIVPTYEITGGEFEVLFPDGKGGWEGRKFSQYEEIPRDIPTLRIPEKWAKQLYSELRKIYDPKDTVSVDAVKMQEKHLEDMRKIAFFLLHDGKEP